MPDSKSGHFVSAVMNQYGNLKAAFEHAIRVAMHETHVRSRKAPEEPDYVAMLTLESAPYIAAALRYAIAHLNYAAAVSSVYCHQSPIVRHDENGQDQVCELGDILFVHFHTGPDCSVLRRNALLLQAKTLSRDSLALTGRDRAQFELYRFWPTFRYERSGPRLNGQQRDVHPKNWHPGAQYLLINDSRISGLSGSLGIPGSWCMAVWPPTSRLYARDSFADILVRFLVGANGRPFTGMGEDATDGWSQLVWDLIERAETFLFNRRNIGIEHQTRAGGDHVGPLNYVLSEGIIPAFSDDPARIANRIRTQISRLANDGEDEPPTGDAEPDEGDEDGGVSVVLIETREAESDDELG